MKMAPTATKSNKKVQESSIIESEKLIAIVRVRGRVCIDQKIKDTLDMLKLHRHNYCTIQKATPSITGMIMKVKDYITWGEIDEKVLKELIEKRSEPNPQDKTKTKSFFRLNPPKKGYGRKGVKIPFVKGGALGYRGEKINDLIIRML